MRTSLLAVTFTMLAVGSASAEKAQLEPEATPANTPPASLDEGRGSDKGAFGVGIVLGEPTGIAAKLYLDDDQAISAAVGSAFIGGGIHVHADYLFHPVILQSRDAFVLPLYIGPGVRGINYRSGRNGANTFAIGIRACIGVLVDFKNVPLDAFLEVAGLAEYEFADGKGFAPGINFGGGARYYF